MKRLLTGLIALLFLFVPSPIAAQDNKDVSWNFSKRLDDLESRVTKLEAEKFRAMVPQPASVQMKSVPGALPSQPIKDAPTTVVREAHGHTHTCPRCNTTWDHDSNPGHNCPNCGTPQYVQDTVRKPVVTRTTSVYQEAPPSIVARSAPVVIRSFGDGGGCANGSCSSSQTRRGIFGWR